MRRKPVVAAAVFCSTMLSMSVAFATPPTGDVNYKDYARSEVTNAASVPATIGTNLMSGQYSIAPGGETGWRRLPGAMVLAVTKGKRTLRGSDQCDANDYATGQAAVVNAGTYRVENTGGEPLEFFGLFFGEPAGAPKPLTEGPTAKAPENCSGVSGLAAADAAPAGVSVATVAAGTFGQSEYGNPPLLEVHPGKDLFATYYDFGPNTSSGWLSHRPAVNIVESGELTYYEGRNGQCVKTEVYRAGQAFYHPAHRHMAVNEGTEHLHLTTVYFDLPHDEHPLPALGNQTSAVDFTQAPPSECPTKLR